MVEAMREDYLLRSIETRDDAAMARIIRTVMPEFGATGSGFAINDPEVDWMHRAYTQPRCAYFVVEREGRVVGGVAGVEVAADQGFVRVHRLPQANAGRPAATHCRCCARVASLGGYRPHSASPRDTRCAR